MAIAFTDLGYAPLARINQFVPRLGGLNKQLNYSVGVNVRHRTSCLEARLDRVTASTPASTFRKLYKRALGLKREAILFINNPLYRPIWTRVNALQENPRYTFIAMSPQRHVELYTILSSDEQLSWMCAIHPSLQMRQRNASDGLILEFFGPPVRNEMADRMDRMMHRIPKPSLLQVNAPPPPRSYFRCVPDIKGYLMALRDGTISEDEHMRMFLNFFE